MRFKSATSSIVEHAVARKEAQVIVSTQAPNGASRAVGTHHWPTRIHVAAYRLRHRRDGNAGTTILCYPRNYRRLHSSSVMTAGSRELLEHGHRRRSAAASAGAAGPSEGLRAGRSSGRTKPECSAASGPRDYGSGPIRQSDDRDSEPDYLLRPTRHGPGMIYNSGSGSFYQLD